jgi:hypothetical protein
MPSRDGGDSKKRGEAPWMTAASHLLITTKLSLLTENIPLNFAARFEKQEVQVHCTIFPISNSRDSQCASRAQLKLVHRKLNAIMKKKTRHQAWGQ